MKGGGKKTQTEGAGEGGTISKSGQEWTLPAQLEQLKNRTTGRWKGIVENSSVVSRQSSEDMG